MVNIELLNYNYYNNTVLAYITSVLIIVCTLIAGKLLYLIFKKVIRKLTEKTKSDFDDLLVDIIEQPAVFALVVAGYYYAYKRLTFAAGIENVLNEITSVLIILVTAWFFIRLLDSLIIHYLIPLTEKTKSDLDDHLVPIARKTTKFIVFVFAFIMILQKLGYNVNALLAGVGIGGLAFAFAAKDVIANIFGGATILADKPFKLKDIVRIDNREGQVIEIGLRSTRIKTIEGTELIVPNAKMTDNIIENVTSVNKRRALFTLGLIYDTSNAKLERAIQIVKDILKQNINLIEEDFKVTFDNFGAYSLDIRVAYNVRDAKNLVDSKDIVNKEIKKRFESEKIEFAYPTQTIIQNRGFR
ncbi:mechanosensitive ion channel family protein [Candidatus Woesearchaeota archaeon]|nr:mechanosensitive ion channel family protein [Candidatus Woesearchaeota archaeon]